MEAEGHKSGVGMGGDLNLDLKLSTTDVQGMKSCSICLQGVGVGGSRQQAVGAIAESQENSPSGSKASTQRMRFPIGRPVAEGSGWCIMAPRVCWSWLTPASTSLVCTTEPNLVFRDSRLVA